MDKLTVTQADEDAADALYNLVSDWQDKYEDWQLAFARHRIAAWNTRQPTQSDAIERALCEANGCVWDLDPDSDSRKQWRRDVETVLTALQEQSK